MCFSFAKKSSKIIILYGSIHLALIIVRENGVFFLPLAHILCLTFYLALIHSFSLSLLRFTTKYGRKWLSEPHTQKNCAGHKIIIACKPISELFEAVIVEKVPNNGSTSTFSNIRKEIQEMLKDCCFIYCFLYCTENWLGNFSNASAILNCSQCIEHFDSHRSLIISILLLFRTAHLTKQWCSWQRVNDRIELKFTRLPDNFQRDGERISSNMILQ